MTIVVWIMIAVAVAVWLSSIWLFVCEWGRGTLDRTAGRRVMFWAYTAWGVVAAALLGLSLAWEQLLRHSVSDVDETVWFSHGIALVLALLLLVASIFIQAHGYARLRAKEREHRNEIQSRQQEAIT